MFQRLTSSLKTPLSKLAAFIDHRPPLLHSPFLILSLLLALVLSILYVDLPLTLHVNEFQTKGVRLFCRQVSYFISPLLHLIIWPALFLGMSLWKKRVSRPLARLCTHIFFGNGVVTLLKILIGRPRPKLFYASGHFQLKLLSFQENFQSFPSRHTVTIALLLLFLSHQWKRASVPFIGLALLISLVRIPTNSHFLSDVIGGILVALLSYTLLEWSLTKIGGLSDDESQSELPD